MTKELRVDIPAGLSPNPEAFPRCTDAQLADAACPAASQVGTQELAVWGTVLGIPQRVAIRVPIHNMTVTPDQVARFSFNPGKAPLSELLAGDKSPIHIVGGVRDTGDFGMYFTIKTPSNPRLISAKQVFCGTPGEPEHDAERGRYCTIQPLPACTGGGQSVLARGEAGTRRPQRQAAAHGPPARRRLQEAPLTDRNQVRGAARSRPGLQFFPPFV